MRIKDKVAIITGAAAGIGLASARRFLLEGARVAICDINEEKLEAAYNQLKGYGDLSSYVVNIAERSEIDEAVASIVEKHGRIDILINNAGVIRDAQMYKMTDDQFNIVIDINLRGTYNFCKAVIPYMMAQKSGRIINTSSVSAFNGNFGQSNYAASKAALAGMTRVMAKELGKYEILVNAVAPGVIYTDMLASTPQEVQDKKQKSIPVRRFGTPEEVASTYLFLSSDDASFINGQIIVVDGGTY